LYVLFYCTNPAFGCYISINFFIFIKTSHRFRQIGDPSQRYLRYVTEICRRWGRRKWRQRII